MSRLYIKECNRSLGTISVINIFFPYWVEFFSLGSMSVVWDQDSFDPYISLIPKPLAWRVARLAILPHSRCVQERKKNQFNWCSYHHYKVSKTVSPNHQLPHLNSSMHAQKNMTWNVAWKITLKKKKKEEHDMRCDARVSYLFYKKNFNFHGTPSFFIARLITFFNPIYQLIALNTFTFFQMTMKIFYC